MKCAKARRLFGTYWDDDATQGEREWLEAHFTACPACRSEYEEYSRALEWVATLPRPEASPHFVERTIARAHRATSAPDRISAAGIAWVPITSAAALLIVAATLVSPWAGFGPGSRLARREPAGAIVRQPELVQSQPQMSRAELPRDVTQKSPAGAGKVTPEAVALVSDSLFDHTEDVEFILDPITLRRGRAMVRRLPGGVEGRRTVISF